MRPATVLALALLVATIHAYTQDALFYDSNGGQYMAIMSSGDVTDFGYNYIINAGRVAMEQNLNMSDTLWIPNIPDNVTAIAKSLQLVAQGYRVIVSGTFSHGNAMSYCASLYPNVTFVQYGGSSTGVPNLSSISWLNSEFWFAIGVFAGATSLNEKVGYIHPGPTPGFIQSINAFYSGVKYANQSKEVYVMYTGALIAVDRATGAANHLVNEIGVGALTGQQDDLTVPVYAMNSGLLAIGVSGYSLRQLYGELVGISFVREWSAALTKVAVGVNGTIYKGDISASFKTAGQNPDTPSHLVTQEQWDILEGALFYLRGNKTNVYACGDWWSQFAMNPVTGCLNSTASSAPYNTQVYPGIHDLGYYSIPLTDKPLPRSTRLGIIITTAILLVLPVTLIVAVICLRTNIEIQAGSPFFFLVMLVGCILVYVGVIIWPLDPSVNNCYARIWLPSMGATIAICALITKNLRIFLLFFNPFRFRGEKLHIKNFLPFVILFMALDAVILGIYNRKGPRGVTVLQGVGGLGTYETRHICATSDTGNDIIYALLVFHMVQLLIGCFVSFMLRNVTEPQYNERKAVGMAIYVTTFCLVIVAVLMGVTSISNEQTVVFTSVALMICTTGVIIIIFGSRFVNIMMGEVDPVAFTKNKSSSGATGTTQKSSNKSSDSVESGVASSRVADGL